MASSSPSPEDAHGAVNGLMNGEPTMNGNRIFGQGGSELEDRQGPNNTPVTSEDEDALNPFTDAHAEEETLVNDSDSEADHISDPDSYGLRRFSESNFGDTESNADTMVNDEDDPEHPTVYIDNANGGTVDEPRVETGPEPAAAQNGGVRNGDGNESEVSEYYVQPEPIIYSDITDDENENENGGEVMVNGIHGESSEDAAPEADVNAGGSLATHSDRPSQQDTLDGGDMDIPDPVECENQPSTANSNASGTLTGHSDSHSQQEAPDGGDMEISGPVESESQPSTADSAVIHPEEALPIRSGAFVQGQPSDGNVFGSTEGTRPRERPQVTEDLSGPYSDQDMPRENQPVSSAYAQTFTGRPVVHGRSYAPAFQPFSNSGDFYVDPIDWDDDGPRLHRAAVNALAEYMRPYSVSDGNFAEKENVPPTHSPLPLANDQREEEHQRQPSPNRYGNETRGERRPYSFGPLRPVPSYPMPSTNISSNAPLTTAHLWYRYVAPEIQDIPEERTFVTGSVRPMDEPQMDFGDMDF